MDHAVVQRWLRSVLGPYGNEDRVFTDVDQTLLAISALAPKTEVYTYDDGRTQLLLNLTGTIPINYRGNTYNIPMEIWMPRAYPREPPIAYVTPTSDMLVRKGPNVDVSGRVGGSYIANWTRKWEACSLMGLIHDCQGMFGQEPPVYAKPKTQSPSMSSPAASTSRANSYTPHSPALAPSRDSNRDRGPPPPPAPGSPAAARHDGAPLRPPKPGQLSSDSQRASPAMPYSAPHQSFSQSSLQSRGSQHWEPRRSSVEPQPSGGQSAQQDWSIQRRHMSWTPAHGPEQSSWQHANSPRQSAYPAPSYDGAAPPPLPPPVPRSATNHDAYWGGGEQPDAGQQVTPSPMILPPRPPNPELVQMHDKLHAKLQARLQHLRATTEEGNAQLRLLCDDLDRGDGAIKDEMARLEAVRDVCRTTGDELENAVRAAQQRTAELKAREDPDVDSLICATSLVGNQLVDLVAEDNAIEDTLYHLGRALHAEVIDLDRFLKQTRYLAREQFMRRALAQKIGGSMGWL